MPITAISVVVKKDLILHNINKLLQDVNQRPTIEDNIVLDKLELISPIQIKKNQNLIEYTIHITFKLHREGGLFSIAGHGNILLNCQSIINIIDKKLNVVSSIIDYKWTEKPKITMGALEIPGKTIGSTILQFYQENLMKAVDKAINESIDIDQLFVKMGKKYLRNTMIRENPAIYSNVVIENIHIGTLEEDEEKITIKVGIENKILLSDSPQTMESISLPEIKWQYKENNKNIAQIQFNASYTFLANIIKNYLNTSKIHQKDVEVTQLEMYWSDKIKVVAQIEKPIQGSISFSANLNFNAQNQSLDFENLETIVHPKNIIYKIVAPLIERNIFKKTKELLPFPIKTAFLQYLASQNIQLNAYASSQFNMDIDNFNIISVETQTDNIEFNIELLLNSLMYRIT